MALPATNESVRQDDAGRTADHGYCLTNSLRGSGYRHLGAAVVKGPGYNPRVNAAQAAALNDSATPLRSVVSRTMMAASEATSTHCPPSDPE